VRYQNTVFGSLLKALPDGALPRSSNGMAGINTSRFLVLGPFVTLIFGHSAGCRACAKWRRCGTCRPCIIITWAATDSPVDLVRCNRRRPSAIFAEVFAALSAMAAGALARGASRWCG